MKFLQYEIKAATNIFISAISADILVNNPGIIRIGLGHTLGAAKINLQLNS